MCRRVYIKTQGATAVSTAGLTATQTLLNGFQTANRTRQAEGQVFASRETLRTTEQNVLLNGATAYMNLLQTAAILELQRSNVNVLEVTLRQTRDRFTAGEVTRTDVAQAESRLAAGTVAAVAGGIELRHRAGAVPAGDRRARPGAACRPPLRSTGSRRARWTAPSARGRTEHPTITTAMYNVDIAAAPGQDRRGRAGSDLVGGRQRCRRPTARPSRSRCSRH